jgi:hypothetical protein
MFMSNYAYILFHGFYVLNLVVCHCNRSTGHMDSNGDSSDDDARHREREEHERRKGKKIATMKANKNKTSDEL